MIKLILNKSLVKVESTDDEIYNQLNILLSYTMNNVFFIPAFKNGFWDGKTRLFNTRNKTFRIGLLTRVVEYLKFQNVEFEIVDNRNLIFDFDFTILDREFVYEDKRLRDTQIEAIKSYIDTYEGVQLNRGMIVKPPRSGKTLTAGVLATVINRYPVLFTVHTIDIAMQTKEVFDKIFDLDCGIIGDGKCNINEFVNVSTIQSIASAFRIKEDVEKGEEEKELKDYTELKNLINRTKTLIIDEAHASSTDMYTELPKYIDNLEHIIGLTGTPFREDGDDMLLEQMCGSIIYELDRQTAIDKGYLLETDLYFVETPKINISKYSSQSQETLGIDENKYLNDTIVNLVNVLENKNTSTVVIVKHRKQGKILADCLGCIYLNGSTSGEERQQAYKDLNDKKILTIVSTVTGIGVDIPTLDNVIISSIGTSKIQAFQRIRCNTPSGDKQCGNVFVLVPNIHIPTGKKDYMKIRYRKIKNIYKKEGGINVYDISYEDIK